MMTPRPTPSERLAHLEARTERSALDISGLFELHGELQKDISNVQTMMYAKVDEIKIMIGLQMDSVRKERSTLTERILFLLVGALLSGVATYILKG